MPKLVQLRKVLCKWFTAVCSEEKPMTRAIMIEEIKSFYDQMKITDTHRSSNKKLHVRTLVSTYTV